MDPSSILRDGFLETIMMRFGSARVTSRLCLISRSLLLQVHCTVSIFKRKTTELNNVVTQNIMWIGFMEMHTKFGHGSEEATREAVKALGWELKNGVMKICLARFNVKAKQTDVINDRDHKPAKEVY
jgi:hypothetical protein